MTLLSFRNEINGTLFLVTLREVSVQGQLFSRTRTGKDRSHCHIIRLSLDFQLNCKLVRQLMEITPDLYTIGYPIPKVSINKIMRVL